MLLSCGENTPFWILVVFGARVRGSRRACERVMARRAFRQFTQLVFVPNKRIVECQRGRAVRRRDT